MHQVLKLVLTDHLTQVLEVHLQVIVLRLEVLAIVQTEVLTEGLIEAHSHQEDLTDLHTEALEVHLQVIVLHQDHLDLDTALLLEVLGTHLVTVQEDLLEDIVQRQDQLDLVIVQLLEAQAIVLEDTHRAVIRLEDHLDQVRVDFHLEDLDHHLVAAEAMEVVEVLVEEDVAVLKVTV